MRTQRMLCLKDWGWSNCCEGGMLHTVPLRMSNCRFGTEAEKSARLGALCFAVEWVRG